MLEKHKTFFECNLNALAQTEPGLAKRLTNYTPPLHFHWLDTETDDPTLEFNLMEGVKPILYHSRHDPKREALRQIESLHPEGASVYLFAGLGLGYSLEALWENFSKTINTLLLLERDVNVFYYFLHRRDWTLLLSNPRVRIVISENPEQLITSAQPFLPHIMGSGIRFIDHRPSFQSYPVFYTAAIEQFRLFLKRAAAESEFLIQHGSLIQRNAILNLPVMCGSHGLGPLRGFFRNQPAVLIAAGPSLDKNLQNLKAHRSKVLVFCVDTAYRIVRKEGIVPDFVAAADPTELNAKHFEGVEPNLREVLVFESDVHPEIPKRWKGSSIFLNSEKAAINQWIEKIAGPFGSFDQGLSVAHTLFHAASWMHCNPIILIGFDLAYPAEGGNTHATGSLNARSVNRASLEDERVTIQPSSFVPSTSQEQIEWVLSVRGDRVPTSKTMAVFLRELSEQIKQSKLTVFDATEGGALIEGSIPSQLANVLSTLEDRQPAGDIVSFLEDHRDPQDIQRIEAFDQLLTGMKKAQETARLGWKKSQELLSVLDSNPNSAIQESTEWKEVDALFWQVHRDSNVQTALSQALFPSMFLFIRQEKDEMPSSRMQKYSNVFESVVRLSDEFIPFVKNSREQIAASCWAEDV